MSVPMSALQPVSSSPVGRTDPREALSEMLTHAAHHSPYYREQDWAAALRAGRSIRFRDIPITDKSLVRLWPQGFYSESVPPAEGRVAEEHTSGSTNQPLLVRMTRRAQEINGQENNRLRSGWGLGSHRRIVHVLVPKQEHPAGSMEEGTLPNGGRWWTIHSLDGQEVFDLLRRTAATVAYGIPSVFLATLHHGRMTSQPLALKQLWTFGEVVSDELRDLLRAIPGCRLVDQYGCKEAGLIALQCPLCDAYHAADRQLRFEVVTDDGRPAEPGEMGRVVVTPFFNRAIPLARYETEDYAVRSAPNACPRSPFAIDRIIGRMLNLFRLPDGRRIRPMISDSRAAALGLRRYKLFQRTLVDLDLHYVPEDPQIELDDGAAQALVDSTMPAGFKVRAVKVADIPRAPGGKYLLHESLI
jgi:phenylacetate-CoA ligase